MLILTRRAGESIVVTTSQGDVAVTVLAIRGSQVRLGIDGARAIQVARSELLTSGPLLDLDKTRRYLDSNNGRATR